MRKIFISGGPGLDEYLSRYFAGPDRIFHAQSRSCAGVDDAIKDLEAKLTNEEEIIMIGHSYGGVLAMEWLARGCKPIVKALVLMSVPLYFQNDIEFLVECKNREIEPSDVLNIFLSDDERSDKNCLQQFQDIFHGFTLSSVEQVMDYMKNFDHRITLEAIKIPVLVLFGDQDIRVPARLQKDYGKTNCRHEVIPGAGHFPFLRKEDLLRSQQAIDSFLSL